MAARYRGRGGGRPWANVTGACRVWQQRSEWLNICQTHCHTLSINTRVSLCIVGAIYRDSGSRGAREGGDREERKSGRERWLERFGGDYLILTRTVWSRSGLSS